jgi:hypothetical protein
MPDNSLSPDLAFLNKKLELCGLANGSLRFGYLNKQAPDTYVPNTTNIVASITSPEHPHIFMRLNPRGQSSGRDSALPHAPASNLAPQRHFFQFRHRVLPDSRA